MSLTLTACSSYHSKFDCPPGKGAGCVATSKVQRLIEDHRLDKFITCKDKSKKYSEPHYVVPLDDEVMLVHFNRYMDQNGVVHREREESINLASDL